MRRDGDKVVIEAATLKSLLAALAQLEPIAESFPRFDDQPPEPVDL
jgi:hypothetical protein